MIHSRRSIRLPSYDYTSSGAYFITLCTQKREHSLGEIINGEIILSVIGEIVSEKWFDIPNHHKQVELGEFIVMPNHIHGIIWIVGARPGVTDKKFPGMTDQLSSEMIDEKEWVCRGKPRRKDQIDQQEERIRRGEPQRLRKFGKPQSGSLSMIINQYKGSVKRWCNKNDNKWFRWQRNYYEHIIRNNKDLFNTSEYIKNNPINWRDDEYKA